VRRHALLWLLMPDTIHAIGLLLGTEEDRPTAFETLIARFGPVKGGGGERHRVRVERITIEPFDLRDRPRYELVVDRLAYWYYHPREWLKKVALMDDAYLLNSPFTFQSMEKHAAYCAMIRCGAQGAEDRPRAVQAPARQRALGVHRGEVQPAVRPRRDRRGHRTLSDIRAPSASKSSSRRPRP